MQVDSKLLFPFFFFHAAVSLKEKKRYEKLNDVAISALKYRDRVANFFSLDEDFQY